MEDSYREGNKDNVRRYMISGARRAGNYWWGSVALFGGVGLLATGLSTLLGETSFPFLSSGKTPFLPQGLVMCFYGCLALVVSLYLSFASACKIGSGFNEFNREAGVIRVFRWGFPGQRRRIEISCPLQQVQAIGVSSREGFNPRQTIYIRLKGGQTLPLTRLDEPITLERVENEAAELAQFLNLPLEG